MLAPALAVGGRYDGGAAESGAGLVLSGRLSYARPARGCWCTRRTASANGAPAARCASIRGRRGAGWRCAWHPHGAWPAAAPAADGARTWRLGTRLRLQPALDLSLQATRRDLAAAAAQHTLTLAASLRW